MCACVYSACVCVPEVFEEFIRSFDLAQRISVQGEYLLECIHESHSRTRPVVCAAFYQQGLDSVHTHTHLESTT